MVFIFTTRYTYHKYLWGLNGFDMVVCWDKCRWGEYYILKRNTDISRKQYITNGCISNPSVQ